MLVIKNNHQLLIRTITLFFTFIIGSNLAFANTCIDLLKTQQPTIENTSTTPHSFKRRTAKETSAEELALALGVDPELSELVKKPNVAQYIYLNYFAEKVGHGELRVALSDIVKDFETNHIDLFTLLTKELDEALNNPDTRKKIEALKASGSMDKDLRPGRFRAGTDRFLSQIKQTLNIIPSMKRAFGLVKEGMSQAKLYETLFHFYGATQLGLSESQLRTWDTTPNGFSDIRPNQIQGMSPMAWVMLAYFASETEAPIVNYSTSSGEITRGLNEALSKFLGTTWEAFEAYSEEEQKDFLQGFLQYDSKDFCTAVWCKEERRHDPALMHIAQQIWGQVRAEEKTYPGAEPEDNYKGADEALKHLIGRNASEWSANSIYFFLMSHASGAASQWVDQPRTDETKHMAIFAASYKYFMGNQFLYRTRVMLDSMKVYSDLHKKTNSVADQALAEKVSLFELSIVHLFIEYRVRKYLKSIPMKTLAKFFEREPVGMTDRDESDTDLEKQKSIQASLATELYNSRNLKRWRSRERRSEIELRNFERENKALLEALVTGTYFSFYGAEAPESFEDQAFRAEFKSLRFGKGRKFDRMVAKSLEATLTDYQIMNNQWVQDQNNLVAVFSSIEAGFEVRHKGLEEVSVLAVEGITPEHTMIRVERPLGLVFTTGAAFRVSIKTRNGTITSRMLSATSSPTHNYLEFAMEDSDSNFKQAVATLHEGSILSVEKVSEGLIFSKGRPMTLIAGGIGVTPFRSLIQKRLNDANTSHTPLTLIHANRTLAPFENEFLDLDEKHNSFNFYQIRSTQTDNWTGEVGRITPEYLKKHLKNTITEHEFYLVGSTGFVTALKEQLLSLGVDEDVIFIEQFGDTSAQSLSETRDNTDFVIPGVNLLPPEQGFLCSCTQMSAEQIQASIDKGSSNIEEIRADLGVQVGGVCGGCTSNILDMLPGK